MGHARRKKGPETRPKRFSQALNALPAALTADMWSHNYLSMINEVQAVRSPVRTWGDGENATTYGLADRFTGCVA